MFSKYITWQWVKTLLKLDVAIENIGSNFGMSVRQNFLLLKTSKIENVLKSMVKSFDSQK